tara:strand:- start:36092 stop:36859 length:768 start_codon:yes stop_codon:yes gene_type:complete
MSETETNPDQASSHLPDVPRMGAESGFDLSEVHVPLRLSGYLCLVLGLVSAFSLLAVPMLLVPVIAILIGLFALRPSRQGRPVGTTAALVGIVLAVGFGACGASVAWFKQKTFGDQAEYFARQYFDVIANHEMELAMELRKDFVNRFSADMPLKTFYETNGDSAAALAEFEEDGINAEIQKAGSADAFELTKAPRVYHKYGHDRVELIFVNSQDPKARKIEVIMECKTDPTTNTAQWHVHRVQYVMKPIYAESVL